MKDKMILAIPYSIQNNSNFIITCPQYNTHNFPLDLLMETNDFNRIEDQSKFQVEENGRKGAPSKNDNDVKYVLLPSEQILTIRRAQVTSSY